MPPSKRIKKTSTAPRSPSSRARPHSDDSAESPNVNAINDSDANGNPTRNTSHSKSGSPSSSVESIDPALLDEEEAPGTPGDTISEPARKAQTYAAGAGGFNALKSFQGQVYSGMAVGGSHTWNYDPGVWQETKEEPDLWKVDYKATKRRARKAPKGSGAPVGTEYHWLIVAHQNVKKVDANTYETSLAGSKYKLAHKTASSKSWSVPTVKGQREREIELLDDAKRRIQGLPPVHAGEKVKVEKQEKGQQKLDMLFGKAAESKRTRERGEGKRKREDRDNGEKAVTADNTGGE